MTRPALRPGRPEDVEAVLALERELFGDDAWSRRLVEDAVPHLVVDDEVTGYAVVTEAGDVADLQRIAVRPDRRRGGLARALLEAALDGTVAERVLLEVRADNAGALGFYAAVGFAEIDRRRRYYRDGSDALVLQRPGP